MTTSPESAPEPDREPATGTGSGTGPETASGTGQGPRRALGAALSGGALGAAVVLVAAGQPWVRGYAVEGGARMPVEASGSDVTGLPSALALVGLAALVAVFAVRRATRAAVALLLAACGAGTLAAALAGASGTTGLDGAAASATGLAHSSLEQVSHSGWPYAAAVGGALLLGAGLLALRYGRHWPAMGSRYEREGAPRRQRAARAPADPERPEELWKALDRGEDPTGPPEGASPGADDRTAGRDGPDRP
ncbi:TIGR02234 family membrane protein [Streptomyces sp. TRM 70351]|uniref:TIGR02234 family membrane protein n=1 Tax=Streptomyces sp. TRM 70351 TaxID=3116552 RepID=UPI002E7BB087|nr:TIGR02234 family membrane protein [Streptomyces sp. TRM 70351]MEE1930474.1 TIGR02234 family membrane protein [Streptomyces sp. TRM 70351]